MAVRQPRYTKEEYAHRGTEIYERRLRSDVEAGYSGKIIAIDIETEDFAIGDSILNASQPLLAHNEDAQIWVVRVGRRTVHRIGARTVRENARLRAASMPTARR